jgi:hypothetical protein
MPDPDDYVLGTPHGNTNTHPTVETKPSHPDYTGGGYERVRSSEYRPHTPGDRKESVYAYLHRLCAVAWFEDESATAEEILPALAGMDVHHNAPEADRDRGIPWDNRESVLEVIEHGRHAEITQTERRAWAEDKKREIAQREQESLTPDRGPACDRCGATDVPLGTGDGFDGAWCPECIEGWNEQRQKLEELEDIEL